MADYIDRQYAIEHYQHVCRRTNCKECPLHIQVTDTLTDCELELFLHNLPSAQPEIILCKDCKHYDDWPCVFVDWYNTADDFCSKAERRNDG